MRLQLSSVSLAGPAPAAVNDTLTSVTTEVQAYHAQLEGLSWYASGGGGTCQPEPASEWSPAVRVCLETLQVFKLSSRARVEGVIT